MVAVIVLNFTGYFSGPSISGKKEGTSHSPDSIINMPLTQGSLGGKKPVTPSWM